MYLAESNFKDNVKVVCNAFFSCYLLNHPAIVGIAVLILCYACLVILLLFALHHSVFLSWDCKGGLKTNLNLWVLQALIINWLSLSIYYPWWCWIKISVYFVKLSYQNINDHWKLPSDSFYYSSSLPYACSCILAAALKLFFCSIYLYFKSSGHDYQSWQSTSAGKMNDVISVTFLVFEFLACRLMWFIANNSSIGTQLPQEDWVSKGNHCRLKWLV